MSTRQLARPTILLVEMDEETQPLLEYNLSQCGYAVIPAVSEEDAFSRLGNARARPDLILLNQVSYSIDEFLEMGRRIREQSGLSASVPVVVIAEQYDEVNEGQDTKSSGNSYISYTEDAQQILDLLARLCPIG